MARADRPGGGSGAPRRGRRARRRGTAANGRPRRAHMTEVNRQGAGPERRDTLRLNLRWKIVGLSVVSMAALTVVLAWAFAAQARTVMLDDLRAQARGSVQALAKNLAYSLATADIVAAQTTVDGIVQDSPDLAYVIVRDPTGKVVADSKPQPMKDVDVDAVH